MAFTVEDFEDLVRLLEERPDWRARLRDLLLPREILELPAAVAQLAEISRVALARERAAMLRKAVPRTRAVVADERIREEAAELAEREDVTRVIEDLDATAV